MKKVKMIVASALAAAFVCSPLSALAQEKKEKVKPYPMDTCVVADEKLGEMGEPYVFTHEGREVKLCCKSCQKEFKKNTAKYMKKMEAAEKKQSKK